MQPIVLTACDHIPDAPSGLVYHRLFRTYTDAFAAAGACTLIVPAQPDADTLALLARTADALLLTGGCDVSPARYGEETDPACGPIDAERDAIEFALLEAFVREKKPVLGICRGAQVINCFFGGTLYQDLPSQCGVSHHGVAHPVACRADSFLAHLFGKRFVTNSSHHQSVKAPGEGLEIVATSGDIVEGLAHTSLPIYAVQFHPERMQGAYQLTPGAPDMLPLFAWFMKQVVTGGVGRTAPGPV